MNTRQLRRREIIRRIVNSLKQAKETGTELNKEEFISSIAFDTDSSIRAVKEYYTIAEIVANA